MMRILLRVAGSINLVLALGCFVFNQPLIWIVLNLCCGLNCIGLSIRSED